MWEEIWKAITVVVLPSALKFFFGPIFGYYAKLHIVTRLIGTAAGMMMSVIAFTYFGDWLRDNVLSRLPQRKKKESTARKRKLLTLWSKYGLAGVAAITPIVFTPIGGAIVAVSFRAPKSKILFYMLISAIVWSFIINGLLYFFGPEILPEFLR